MHPIIFDAFEKIVRKRNKTGTVLEIGAIPSPHSLLNLKALEGATEKIGVNLDGPYDCTDYKIVAGNGNAMDYFEDNRFDVVLSNATIEHDKFFWKTLSEIRRVAKPGGLIIIGGPGFTRLEIENLKPFLKTQPEIRSLVNPQYLNALLTGTITHQIHGHPGDYYRFSPQAFQDVIFEGLQSIELETIMLPPRIIGSGIMPED